MTTATTPQFSKRALDRLRDHPLFEPSPDHNPALQVVTHGEPLNIPVRFFFYRDVLVELRRAFAADPRRAFAVLIGTFRVDQGGPYLEIVGFESLTHLDDTQDLLPLLQHAVEELTHPDKVNARVVIGWAGHLPGEHAAFTQELVRVHLSLFNIPLQLSVSFDLAHDKLACYARLPNQRFLNPPIAIVHSR
jgi:hypothetical protein